MNTLDPTEPPELAIALREHYTRAFGEPPAPSALWARLAPSLRVEETDDASDLDDVYVSELDGPASDTHAPNAPMPLAKPRQRGTAGRLTSLGALAAAVAVALLGASIFHVITPGQAAATPTMPASQNRHILTAAEVLADVDLNDVQMLSPTDGWAVGDRVIDNETKWKPLILHYTQGRWSEVPLTITVANASLSWISMDSSDDGWAGGTVEGQNAGFLLHYANGTWTEVATPDGWTISNIQMLSPTDGWAVEVHLGDLANQPTFYLLHYSDGAWTRVSQEDSHVVALSMLSPTDGWAAGENGVIERYHDGTWTRWAQNAPGDVTTIQMLSPTDGWLAGAAPNWNAANDRPFVMHFDGHQWKEVSLPTLPTFFAISDSSEPAPQSLPTDIAQIAMTSATDGWMAGSLRGISSLTYHYSGGTWSLDPFAVNLPLNSISMISANEGWAVGSAHSHGSPGSGKETAAVIERYVNGAWTIYKP